MSGYAGWRGWLGKDAPQRLARSLKASAEEPRRSRGHRRLRSGSSAEPGSVVLGLAASGAATSLIPTRHSAVGYLRATSAALRISHIAHVVQLLHFHGGPGISPRKSHRQTTGGVTLHTAAAWPTEVTCSLDSPHER